MPFTHKYQEYDFLNGFQTHNSILDTVPYDPEVIFIGTYNHGWSWNNSDFYYGRDMYMWTILANIFLHNKNLLIKKRNQKNNIPEFSQLFEICKRGKIVFADIVKGVSENIKACEQNNNTILVNNKYKWSTYKDKELDEMGSSGWLDDNVEAILQYINNTKSLNHVYFTFKSGNWLVDKLNDIINGLSRKISYCSIFTPTANGFWKNLQAPFNKRAWSLSHCWVWNGLDNDTPINKPNYGHLDHKWLINNGVNPNNF